MTKITWGGGKVKCPNIFYQNCRKMNQHVTKSFVIFSADSQTKIIMISNINLQPKERFTITVDWM